MKKNINYELLWVVFCVLLLVIGIGGTVLNAKSVCKNQEVFWVRGTQFSCSVFK